MTPSGKVYLISDVTDMRNPMIIYDYQPSRKVQCVQNFLADYSGYLLSDGYSAYDKLENVT